ncbi:MAG: hypothetical protein IH994_04035 [Proteobacteria bacterium]|nr:hypothetical protein [Pseudomonadota bacterium]
MKNLSRREALNVGGKSLAVAGAATAILGIPLMAKADDSRLFAMNRKLEAARVKENDACHAYSEAEGAAFKEAGPKPQDPGFIFHSEAPEGWNEKVRKLAAEHGADKSPEAKERAEKYKRAVATYEKAKKHAVAKHGVEAADRRSQKALEHTDAIEAELLAIPAVTVAGVLLKARILTGEGDPSEAAVRGLLTDLERLAGGAS